MATFNAFQDPASNLSPDALHPDQVASLPGLFYARLAATPDRIAYRHFDPVSAAWQGHTWRDCATQVARWQAALARENLAPGDRVAIMLRNGVEWITFDVAAMSLGLITVPLYLDDRPDNAAYILDHAGAKLLLVEGRIQHRKLAAMLAGSSALKHIVSLQALETLPAWHGTISLAEDWLRAAEGTPIPAPQITQASVASVVYTSGTTGRPKGVMLTHGNILWNIHALLQCGPFRRGDVFLSFLPLSHTFERTCGCYLPMAVGAEVAFARSLAQLVNDLETIAPSVLISVPRIYERMYQRIRDNLEKKPAMARKLFALTLRVGRLRFEHAQGRAAWRPELLLWPLLAWKVARPIVRKLGGRLKFAVSGGAALSQTIADTFISLGIPLLQGYGLTETSPVISVNRPGSNLPASIGLPLPGIEVAIGADDELLTRSRSVMLGYWNNPEATHAMIDEDGWLHTGDKARIDARGHLYITGRIKDIIVLSNGEKVPPADMEAAILLDPLFEQALIVGEARPCLAAIVTLNAEHWAAFATEQGLDPNLPNDENAAKMLLQRVGAQLRGFPGYAQVRRLHATRTLWSVDQGLLTPTLKIKRAAIASQYQEAIAAMYATLDRK